MLVKVHQQPILQLMLALGFRYKLTDEFLISDLHATPPEQVWESGFRKHDRQAVKYYEQQGAGFGLAARESDYIDYLGLLPRNYTGRLHSTEFFSRMRSNLGDKLKVAIVTVEGKVIAGTSMLCDPANSVIHLTTIRYSAVRNMHSPVTYLNWKTINWAAEHGYRFVHFGDYSVAEDTDPNHPFHRLKMRFQTTSVPNYLFTLPVARTLYSVAKMMNRVP
jgi:hypothetical protein